MRDSVSSGGWGAGPDPRFVAAGWFWRLVLRLLGGSAIAMPWGRVYLIEDTPETRRHELAHLEQIERDGALWFSVRYLWWLMRYGYRNNPYEVEAYRRQRPA